MLRIEREEEMQQTFRDSVKTEQKRVATEQGRVRAELLRIEREEQMQQTFRDAMLAEQKRLEDVVVRDAETKHQEAKRIAHEMLRQSNEYLRIEMDVAVANQHLTQLSNEVGRIKAEKKRENKFAEIQAQSKSLGSAQEMKGVASHIDELKIELKEAEVREKCSLGWENGWKKRLPRKSAQEMERVASHIDRLKKELKESEVREYEDERKKQLWYSFAHGNGKFQN
jgi:hypothetical protein